MSGTSCDSCHQAGWRTNCTYCHGGTDNATGAPPHDLNGTTTGALTSFPGHTAHVSARTLHAAWDCTQCHVKPTDVLSTGHAFDATPAKSEVVFTGGLSPVGTYANKTCGTSYCHGNGRASNGTVTTAAAPMTCASCHPGPASTLTQFGTMSGQHRVHMEQGVRCNECHGATVNAAGAIIDPTKHVNGLRELLFAVTPFAYASGRCNGTCHNQTHTNETW